ncbi:MAG TPA: MFS transporter [Marmoricola sp.]|jgi:MFS family permease|nr:MFS transporter [Nocardioidaceae bacterium]MCB8993853.1 MFS transporter [Nocardioidaceae bacterium]MCO5325049.1 MFS transporter [Nocardioidaceae bacterium]HMY08041.1 MFS transporter [Marmoricola sp.]HRV68729.1 MFS transporter [Marmoricola sp.]
MFEPYRKVFAYPGAWQFSATGVIARLPISMMTLSIVVMVSELSGSYTRAGQVSAAYVVGNAGFAIIHGRLIDHFGQRLVLLIDTVAFAMTTILLMVAINSHWALGPTLLFAVLSGMSIPQIGAMIRSRWSNLVTNESDRHTAFSVEAVVDEMVFVIGPVLVAVTATAINPASGLVISVIAGTIGTLLLAAQRRTEPPKGSDHDAGEKQQPMHWGSLAPIAIGAIAYGALFGALEVGAVSFADHAGHKAGSGILLALFSFGSLLAGVVTGAIVAQSSPFTRSRRGMWTLACGTLALPFVTNLWVMGLVLVFIGLALAPTLIALFSLVEATTPQRRLNEALGVIQTGVSGGVAPGAWLAGLLADDFGGNVPFMVCTVSAFLAASASLFLRDKERSR